MNKQVFISYRQESPEHGRAVRRLGELLKQAGLPVLLDQFYMDDHPGGPNEGWPKWCEDAANQSECVLIIGSPGWFAAYDNTGPAGVGRGAASEAALFRQDLYNNKSVNARIRLAYLDATDPANAPLRLQAWHHFQPFIADAQLSGLVQWIAGVLHMENIQSPVVCWPAPTDYQPDQADRSDQEWPAIRDLLAGRARQRILLCQGGSGLGKSLLLRHARKYADRLDIPTAHIDFKSSGPDVAAVHGQLDLDLSAYLPNFSREGANKVHLLRKDLRALRRPLLVTFDTYEAIAGNQPLENWLSQQFLAEVETALGLTVMVAGQKVPDPRNTHWADQARLLTLVPITELSPWDSWVEKCHPIFKEKGGDLRTLLGATQGNPANMANLCEAFANNGSAA